MNVDFLQKSQAISRSIIFDAVSSYPARNMKNIEESDGTVIFSLERVLVAGTKLTWVHANKVGKPGAGTSMMPGKNEFRTQIRFA